MHLGQLDLLPREENAGITAQELFGPVYFGIIFNYLLWGIQFVQSYRYYKAFRKTDMIWIQIAVGLVGLFDTAQSVITSQEGWRFMVDGWSSNDVDAVLQTPGWGSYSIPLADGLTIAVVFFFWAHRIWSLYDRPQGLFYAIIVVALSIVQLIGGIGCAAIAVANQSTLPEFSQNKTWSCLWLVTATVGDVLITVLLSLKLSKSRKEYKPTDNFIGKITRGGVETGLAATILQLMTLIIYLAWTSKPAFIVFGCILPKVYSNSMLAVLNARLQQSSGYQGLIVNSLQEQPVGGIRVHTTQTVDVSSDYEVSRRAKRDSKQQRMRVEQLTPPDAATPFVALPSQHKNSL